MSAPEEETESALGRLVGDLMRGNPPCGCPTCTRDVVQPPPDEDD